MLELLVLTDIVRTHSVMKTSKNTRIFMAQHENNAAIIADTMKDAKTVLCLKWKE